MTIHILVGAGAQEIALHLPQDRFCLETALVAAGRIERPTYGL